MLDTLPGSHPKTVAADKAYDTRDFIAACRRRRITPRVAANDTRASAAAPSMADDATSRLRPSARRSANASRSTSAGARPSVASARRYTAGSSAWISAKLTMTASNIVRMARMLGRSPLRALGMSGRRCRAGGKSVAAPAVPTQRTRPESPRSRCSIACSERTIRQSIQISNSPLTPIAERHGQQDADAAFGLPQSEILRTFGRPLTSVLPSATTGPTTQRRTASSTTTAVICRSMPA